MANWDHLSNIGTHPVLDPDPNVRIPARVEAAERHIARFTAIRDDLLGGPQIPAGSQVTVTIGRNVTTDHGAGETRQTPMGGAAWACFTDEVHAVLDALVPELLFTYAGVGEWDGVSEESLILVAINTTKPLSVEFLESDLRAIAAQYGQDAIAYSVGTSTLVTR